MHDKMITYKLLSFIEKADDKVGAKIMSVINKTLPTPTQQCSPTLKQYLNYVGDVLLNCNAKSDQEAEILSKMTKAKDQSLNEKILKIVCQGLSKGILKQKLFSVLSLVLDSDRQFTTANIEFDLKSFVIENSDLNKKDERFIKIDMKKFGSSFTKYEEHPLLM